MTLTREQKIQAYEMKVDGKSNKEIASYFGVDPKDLRKELSTSRAKAAGGTKVDQFEMLADICAYPGLAQCIRDNELTAKDLFLLLRGSTTESGKPASGFVTWLKPRLTGDSDFTTAQWLKLSAEYGVSLDVLMKPSAPVYSVSADEDAEDDIDLGDDEDSDDDE